MRELPSQGRCHAALLLAFSARMKALCSFDEWVNAASNRATFLASAGDIAGTAQLLLSADLVTVKKKVILRKQLADLSMVADRNTLVGIARLLLLRYPPSWIPAVVVEGHVLLELIPPTHLERLAWLGEDLEPLLIEVHRNLSRNNDDDLRQKIGLAGELAVMSSLIKAGLQPFHVSLLSDTYGYDIDYDDKGTTRRIEVKSAVERTSDRLILSKNEFKKSQLFQSTWSLIQVVFSSRIVITKKATFCDILAFRELAGETLHAIAPTPSGDFDWLESAEFRPGEYDWSPSRFAPDATFQCSLAPD